MSPLILAGRFSRCLVVFLLLGAVAAGCSKSRHDVLFTPGVGHPDGWDADHGAAYLKDALRCAECHGADLSGGISAVSCSRASLEGVACHTAGPSSHPDGWEAAPQHGVRAKAAPGATSGFSWCQRCHGADFGGGGINSPCVRCHGVPAPHPRAPWRGGSATHVTTSSGNAAVCAACHRREGAGGEPGCFNNTLCHAQQSPHPGGWENAASHGAAAKRAPGSATGFSWCTDCHGADYRGGSGVSCFSCHGVNAPHAPSPWRARYTHTTTDQRNAAACLRCHRNANPPPGAKPGCFNNTLCHPHAPGWADPDQHGAGAKAAPSPTRGFPACQSCHGRLFDGGVPGASCYRAGGCHTSPTPHSPGPWRSARTHTTTNGGNVVVCTLCHRRPSAPAALPDNCFNNSLCHSTP